MAVFINTQETDFFIVDENTVVIDEKTVENNYHASHVFEGNEIQLGVYQARVVLVITNRYLFGYL